MPAVEPATRPPPAAPVVEDAWATPVPSGITPQWASNASISSVSVAPQSMRAHQPPTGADPVLKAPEEYLRAPMVSIVGLAIQHIYFTLKLSLGIALLGAPFIVWEARGFNRLAYWLEEDGADLRTESDPERFYNSLYLDGYLQPEALFLQLSYIVAPLGVVTSILYTLRRLCKECGNAPPTGVRRAGLACGVSLLLITYGIPPAGISVLLGSPLYFTCAATTLVWTARVCKSRLSPEAWSGVVVVTLGGFFSSAPIMIGITDAHMAMDDGARLLLRVFLYPLAMELSFFSCRHFARMCPHLQATACVFTLGPALLAQVVGRVLLLLFDSPGNAALCIILVTVQEAAFRATAVRRDAIFYRVFFRWDRLKAKAFVRDVNAIRATHAELNMEQVGELVGTALACLLAISFRLSLTLEPPSTASIVLQSFISLGLELTGDLVVPLLLAVAAKSTASTDRLRYLHRISMDRLLSWPRIWQSLASEHVFAGALSTVGMVTLGVLFVVVPVDILCPISSWRGWYHWVPCLVRDDMFGL